MKTDPRRDRGGLAKRVAVRLALLVLVLGISLGGILLWLASDIGMVWLAARLSRDLDGDGLDIDVARLEGSLFSRFSVHGLRVADDDGVWLKAPKLVIAWSPTELLSRDLHITELSGEAVTLSRLPNAIANAKKKQTSTSLPVAIQLDTAALPIRYDGDMYALSVARAAYDGDSVRGDAKLSNADKTDSVTATFDWLEGDALFKAHADMQARAGGLITGLLGLGRRDNITATLDAAGSVDDWEGAVKVSVPGKLALEGDGQGTAELWQIKLRQSLNALLPADFAPLLGGAAEADITIEPNNLDDIQLDLVVRADGLDAHLAGQASIEGGFSLTRNTLDVKLAHFVTGTTQVDGVVLAGELGFRDSLVDLTYNARLDKIIAADLVFADADVTGSALYDAGQLSGEVGKLTLTMTPPGLDETRITATGADWSYNLESEVWQVAARAVNGTGITARDVAATGSAEGLKSASGHAEVPVSFLARWHDGQLTGGRLRLDVKSPGSVGAGTRLAGTVKGEKLTYASDVVAELLGPTPTINAGMIVSGAGTTIERAVLEAANMDVTATGSVGDTRIDLAFDGNIGALEKLLGDGAILAGKTAFSGAVKGDSDTPTVTFQTGLEQIDAYGVVFTKPEIRLSLSRRSDVAGGLMGDVRLKAQSALGETLISSPLSFFGGKVILDEINLSAPGATATGALSWSDEQGLAANLDAVLRDIKGDNLNLGGQGSISLNVAMVGDDLDVGLTLDMAEVRLARPGHFPLTVEMAKGTAGFHKQAKTISYAADLIASNINYGAQKVETLLIKGTSSDSAPLTAEMQGYLGNRFDLAATAKPQKGGVDIGFNATYGDAVAATREPIILRWGGEEDLSVNVPLMDAAGGTLEAKLFVEDENLTAELKASALAMSAVNLVRPGSIETGTLDVDFSFHRQAGSETGNMQLTFDNLTLPHWRLAAAPDVYAGSMQAVMKEGTIKFDGNITEAGKEFGRLSGDLPYVRVKGQRGYAIRDGAPLAMELVWQGDVAPIWLLARRPEHLLTGTLDGKLALSGVLEDPHFEGQLDLRDGHYEYEPLGLVANIETLRVSGTEDHIRLSELRANDGKEGSMTGEGEFELSSKLAFPGRLTVELSDFQVARLDELNGTASASLVYERTDDTATLSGQVKTGPMRVKMPKELPRSVIEIDVIEINGAEELEALGTQSEPKKNRPTNLSLAIEVPGRFYFEGRGLKSEWQGNLLLGGTSDKPEITGSMSVRDGSFSFGSKTFDITNGQLTFRGGSLIDPDIAVTAVHTTSNLEAQLQISGPASAPDFTLSSTPSLPEDEIMSRVLLGKSVSDLSALQLAELVVAMDTLRGGGSFDVVGKLRRGLGLDTLSFGRTDDEDESATTITGGKYLRKNIYLEVETSTASSETATRLKIDLTKNLLVETEIGPRQGSSLRLKWFWDY